MEIIMQSQELMEISGIIVLGLVLVFSQVLLFKL